MVQFTLLQLNNVFMCHVLKFTLPPIQFMPLLITNSCIIGDNGILQADNNFEENLMSHQKRAHDEGTLNHKFRNAFILPFPCQLFTISLSVLHTTFAILACNIRLPTSFEYDYICFTTILFQNATELAVGKKYESNPQAISSGVLLV